MVSISLVFCTPVQLGYLLFKIYVEREKEGICSSPWYFFKSFASIDKEKDFCPVYADFDPPHHEEVLWSEEAGDANKAASMCVQFLQQWLLQISQLRKPFSLHFRVVWSVSTIQLRTMRKQSRSAAARQGSPNKAGRGVLKPACALMGDRWSDQPPSCANNTPLCLNFFLIQKIPICMLLDLSSRYPN